MAGMETEVKNFISSRGWEYKRQGDEYRIKLCPFCGNAKYKLWINADTGAYRCFICETEGKEHARGSLKQLKDRCGDFDQPFRKKTYKKPTKLFIRNCHKRLFKKIGRKGLKYLKKRGFSKETIKRFKLGYAMLEHFETGEKSPYVIIPHIDAEGHGYDNWKGRSLPPASKDFRRFYGAKTVLWNQTALKKFPDEIIVTEGETDGLSFWEGGFKNVVAVTAGAGTLEPTWFDKLVGKKIYLAYDADAAGQKGMLEAAKRLGEDNTFFLELPKDDDIKDWNDVLTKKRKHFKAIVQKAMDNAKAFSMLDIFTTREAFSELLLNAETGDEAIMTPWPRFNEVSKGINPGDLCILASPPKQGKTAIAQGIALHNLLDVSPPVPTLFFCLESRPYKIMQRFIASICRVETDHITKDEIMLAQAKLWDKPLYFGWCKRSVKPDVIFDTISHAVRRLGIKLLVFDHLQFLVRDKRHIVEETSIVSKNFKFLAEELGVALILIAHPRKIPLDKPMNMYDLRDSSSIPGDADRIWLMHRRRLPVEGSDDEPQKYEWEPETLLYVEASRWSGTGSVMLYFDQKYLYFEQLDSWKNKQKKSKKKKKKKKRKASGIH